MSFGLDIETDEAEWVEVVDGHTYNLSPMWRKALPAILADKSTSELDGWSCAALLPHLDKGLLDAVRNRKEYERLNPDNGWGDYDGFLSIYMRFVQRCHENPTGIVRWNG